MARIYKESRYALQLLIGKSYVAQYKDIKISFYTKNPNNQVMVDNGITIKRNIAEVKIESTLFDNLEDGLIKYIVYGTKDGIPFIEERISNYFLKTPLDFKPGESGTTCNLGIGEYGFDSNSVGDYELYASDDGYDGWSKMFIHIYGDDGAISVRRASGLLDDFANNIEVLDFGWNYYVGGIITEIQEIYTLNGNYLGYATYILDNGFKIYRGKWISGNDFSSKDQIKLGAYVIVFGRLQNNNGELGLEEGSQVVAYQEYKPKINLQETGLKLGYSSFTEVPEWADFEGITNMAYMFYSCDKLQTIPLIDTSNVTGMSYMFGNCYKLQTIPLIDTSNVIYMNNMFSFCIELQTIPLIDTSNVTRMDSMFQNCSNLQTIPQIDTSNVTNMEHMFQFCYKLKTIPQIDTSNVTSMNYMFSYCQDLQTLPKFNCQKVTSMARYFSDTRDGMSALTDVGGWENLKCNWDDAFGLATCPNLTYQSCINILNGLYDFVGNGSTETRTLNVHPNFLTTVGDEISIGTSKGWTIV